MAAFRPPLVRSRASSLVRPPAGSGRTGGIAAARPFGRRRHRRAAPRPRRGRRRAGRRAPARPAFRPAAPRFRPPAELARTAARRKAAGGRPMGRPPIV